MKGKAQRGQYLLMVSEVDTGLCANEELFPIGVDTRQCVSKDAGPKGVRVRMLALKKVDLAGVPFRLEKGKSDSEDTGP